MNKTNLPAPQTHRVTAQHTDRVGPVAVAAEWCWDRGTSPDPDERRSLAWTLVVVAAIIGALALLVFRSARRLEIGTTPSRDQGW